MRGAGIRGAGLVSPAMQGAVLGLAPFTLDTGAMVFTPGMAKRAVGVFASAPIVQGSWASGQNPDSLTFPRGALLGNRAREWYANLDPYQGTFVLWITPEWDGDDGESHYFIAGSSGMIFGLSLYKNSDDELVFQSDSTELAAVDVSAWTAGTTYCVVASWDTRNPIGTNYARLSIDLVHTYSHTSTFSPTTNPTIRVGSAFTAGITTSPANAIIEGLTVFRRVLTDENGNGTDVGNAIGSDELTEIYAAGAGADPCLTDGSWDKPFCLPTDATPGPLTTGTGEAWSHPHGSALPTHAFVDDGGYMSEPFAVFYDGTDTDIDCGSGASLDDLPNLADGVQMEIWVRADDWGESNTAHLLSKYVGDLSGGWNWGFDSANGLFAWVYNLTTDSFTQTGTDDFSPDGKWHHFLFSFHHVDQGGDSKIYMAIDGKWVAAYTTQNAGVGAFQSDAAVNFHIGNSSPAPSHTQEGCVGWVAVWNDVTQYTVGTDFVPLRVAPGPGGNLQESWHLDEGTGVNVAAQVTSPGNDGTIANLGAWERQWEPEATPVIPQSVNFDALTTLLNATSGANIDNLPQSATGFEAETWFRCDDVGEGNQGRIFDKAGWILRITSAATGTLRFFINYDNTDVNATTTVNVVDSIWHHVKVTYDENGDRIGRIWLDGILAATSAASVGNYAGDAASDLIIGNNATGTRTWDGNIGAVRLSNTVRDTATFTPPDRTDPGAQWTLPDANTMLQYLMVDGAGATVTDASASGYNGTLAGTYRWDNTYDQTLDSPGAGPFQNGYVFGVDGVGDGIGHQFVVTAETDYVARVMLSPGQDSRGLWNVYLYDVTGAAQIGANYQAPSYHGAHTGGAVSPTLDDNTARWPQSLLGATAYNITQGTSGVISAIDGGMQSLTAGINWNNGDEYRVFWQDGYHKHPWCEPFVFRTPVGCVLAEVRLLSLDGEGTLHAHQVEIQESIINDGDMEAAFVGVPPIPPSWTNQNLDAGDTAQGATVHSGAQSLQFNVGASSEYLYDSLAGEGLVEGDFYAFAGWMYGDGTKVAAIQSRGGLYSLFQTGAGVSIDGAILAAWYHGAGVLRGAGLAATDRFRVRSGIAPVGNIFVDDCYSFELDPVSLTVTPASAANSAESGGTRLDGYDDGPQPVVPAALIQASQGRIVWAWRPRHDAADLVAFGNAGATLLHAWGNATNYIRVYATAANNVRLEFNDGGGVHQANWNCTGLVVRDTLYLSEVRYHPAGMDLLVDDVVVATIAQPVAFAVPPTVVYWGSRQAGDEQFDCVFVNP